MRTEFLFDPNCLKTDCPFSSPRHATSFLGSYCGRSLAKKINRSSALSEVANECTLLPTDT